MSDPSLLVSMPSCTDRSLAPEGGQVLSVVAPTPNLDRRSGGNPDLDWAPLGPRYRDEVLATLEARGWTGLTGAIEVEEMATPLDWAAQGMAAGTPFALAHTFGQTGPFRPLDAAPPRARRTSSSPARRCSRASACRWC